MPSLSTVAYHLHVDSKDGPWHHKLASLNEEIG